MASKKKVSGNTMTLRDFHGGSIPSDLPLPSAPSLTVKASDRGGNHERASSWGNRSRPHTSPSSTRHLDEKTPFFAHSAHQIGRNFDEDERKPLDSSVSAPRRTVRDDTFHQRQGASNFISARGSSGGTSNVASWSAPNAVSKLVHSSSVDEKVSSFTWHSSKTLHHPHQPQRVDGDHSDGVLSRHSESGLAVLDDQGQILHGDGGRNEYVDSKHSELQRQQYPVPSGPSERPKLKLLPRTKALESSEPSVPYSVQVHDQANSVQPDGTGSGKEAGHRTKLNLKPRLQPIELLEEKTERDGNAVYGGARPRELVLKDRGIDDAAINNLDVVEHSNRIEHTAARADKLPNHSHQTRYGEKIEGAPHDRWTGKKIERKEQRVDVERVNVQGKNWRSDIWRNSQQTDRKQVSERQPSPDTWRKPAEPSKSAPGAVSTGHGKAASAIELAEAFSRSAVSSPTVNNRFSGERGVNPNNRTQMPFSRLVGPTTPTPRHPRINGY